MWNNVQAEFGRIKDDSGFQIARGFYRNLQVTSEYLVLQSDLRNRIQLDNKISKEEIEVNFHKNYDTRKIRVIFSKMLKMLQ